MPDGSTLTDDMMNSSEEIPLTPNRNLSLVDLIQAATPPHPQVIQPPPPIQVASAAAPTSNTEGSLRDRVMDDSAGANRGIGPSMSPIAATPSDPNAEWLKQREAEYDKLNAPRPKPSLKEMALKMLPAVAPLAALPFVHGTGAPAGAAAGVSRGIGSYENVMNQQNIRQQQQEQAQKGRLLQEIAQTQRTAEQERAATQRNEYNQLQETGRNTRNANTLAAAMQRTNANNLTKEDIAQAMREEKAREQQAGFEQQDKTLKTKMGQNMDQFRQTLDYKKWKAGMDDDTRKQIAQLRTSATQDKAPAALMQTAVFAKGGIKSLDDAEGYMRQLEQSGVMGSLPANKVEDWIFGKGLVDPTLDPHTRQIIGGLRTSVNLASSAMTRAHTQRGSKEVYDDLKQRLGINQDWSALRGAIAESKDMLGQYVMAASDANIASIRGGTNMPAQGGAGGGGANQPTPPLTNFHVNPQTGARIGWDSGKKQWVPAPKTP